jgi:hypothetical protein
MRILSRQNHVATWVLLLILAYESIQVIPARQRFFADLPHPGHGPGVVALYVSLMPLVAGIVYVLFCQCSWRFRQEWYRPHLDFRGLGIQAVAALAVLSIDRIGFRVLFHGETANESFARDFLRTMTVLQIAGFLAATINGLESTRAAVAQKAREAQEALLDARARLVVAQLDPHAMFNSLAGVESLIDDDPEQAKVMIGAASDYLKKLLRVSQSERIPLAQERALIAEYLTVERYRMGDRLAVEWEWPATWDAVMVPPLLVQPLVENAIKHGIWPHRQGGTLRLTVSLDRSKLTIAVANSGAPLAPVPREGAVGLENLRARLGHAYGSAAAFGIATRGPWTVAEISIPLESPCVA